MTNEGKFGLQEAIWLITITSSTKLLLTNPAMSAKIAGTAGWYVPLISMVFTIIWFTFIFLLLKRYPGNNIMEIYETVLGRFLGSIFSCVIMLALLSSAALSLREFVEVKKVYILVRTPISLIITCFIIVTIILSFLGLEAIARYSKLISFILLFSFILILILSSQNYQSHRLFPILGYGLGNTLFHGFMRSSMFGEIIIIAIIAKSLHGINEIKKTGFISIIFSGILVSVAYLTFLLTFSYFLGRELTAPIYVMASLINYGFFFQRVESIFMFIWNLTSLISIAVLLYSSLMVYCHIFRIKDKRPLIIPFGIILFTLTIIPQGLMHVISIYRQFLMNYGWMFFYVPSLIVLLSAIILRKKGNIKNA